MSSTISSSRGILQHTMLGPFESPNSGPSASFHPPHPDFNDVNEVELLSVSWNQDYGCFAAGTSSGFRIFNCEPFKETLRRDLKSGGFKIVEMLFRSNILALVGSGGNSLYPPSKVILWDDHQSRCIGEFAFRSDVRAVKLRRDRFVVIVEHKIYVYSFIDLKLLHQIETLANMIIYAVMDTFYISHGAPTLAIDDSLPARHFLKTWQEQGFTEKPKSVLIISGHWETDVPTVNVVQQNDIIYDFYGFPSKMYKLKYPAPGAPELAKRVKELLTASGFRDVKEDTKRGLDHGAWIPMMLMYPEADIPVCQLSVQTNKDGTHHYNMGKALAPLREEGVLIMGSGSAVHNLRAIRSISNIVPSWAQDFDNWLRDALLQGRYEDVNHYEEKAPNPKMAHPWPDHFFPLHVAIGAAGENSKAQLIHSSWQGGTLSYASYKFTKAT